MAKVTPQSKITLSLMTPTQDGNITAKLKKTLTLSDMGFAQADIDQDNFHENLQDYANEWSYELYEGHFSYPSVADDTTPATIYFDLFTPNPTNPLGGNMTVLAYREVFATTDLLDGTQWQGKPLSELSLNDDELYHHLIDLVVAWADRKATATYSLAE